jgi:hypothetical protein
MPPESSDEARVYRNPDPPYNLANIDRSIEFWEGDPVFNLLCWDLGVTADELLHLLRSDEPTQN